MGPGEASWLLDGNVTEALVQRQGLIGRIWVVKIAVVGMAVAAIGSLSRDTC